MGALVQTISVGTVNVPEFVQSTLDRLGLLDDFSVYREFWPYLGTLVEGVVEFASPYLPDTEHPQRTLVETCFIEAGKCFVRGEIHGCTNHQLNRGCAELLRPLLQAGRWNISLGDDRWRPEDGQRLLPALVGHSDIDLQVLPFADWLPPVRVVRGLEKTLYQANHVRRLRASLEELLAETD